MTRMARSKKLQAPRDHGSSRSLCVVLLCIAGWCLILATADSQVYNVVLMNTAAGGYTTLGVSEVDVSTRHDALLSSALGALNGYTKLYSYSRVMDGFSVKMTAEQADILRNMPHVLQVQADTFVQASTTHTYEYMGLPGGAWNRLGGTMDAGEDVVIAVIDTGIYPDHPSFANETVKPYFRHPTFKGLCDTDPAVPTGFCNGKIIGARHFFDGAISAGVGNASDPGLNSPLDGAGHGTHCAGTAAGNYGVPVIFDGYNYGNASGTAPRARLAIYKALDAKGSGVSSDIIMAIDQAILDGVDVISLSLGPTAAPVTNATYTDSLEIACLGAVRSGVFVVQAAGNTGPGPATVTSWSPWITSVAASTTDRSYPSALCLGNNQTLAGFGFARGATLYPTVRATDAAVSQASVNPDFDCADPAVLDKSVVTGKILVCTWDGVPSVSGSLSNLSRIAGQVTGAVGVVLLLNMEYRGQAEPPIFSKNYPLVVVPGLPVVDAFLTYYGALTPKGPAGKITQYGAMARLTGGNQAVFSGLPPQVAGFSSRGPDINMGLEGATLSTIPAADVLKPNVLAPGVDIWSAWSPLPTTEVASAVGQKFAIISGTSMATPHFAGVAALVKQAHPDWSPAMLSSALLTTAVPSDSLGQPLVAIDDQLDSSGQLLQVVRRPGNAFDYGSGFVNAYAALDPGLIFNATFDDYIKFMCSMTALTSADVTAATAQRCPPSPGLPSDLNLPSITIGNLNGSRIVPRTVTNVGPLETYTASVIPPGCVNVTVTPGNFTITPGASQALVVTLKAAENAVFVNQTSYGKLYLTGSLGHRVQVPLTVAYKTV